MKLSKECNSRIAFLFGGEVAPNAKVLDDESVAHVRLEEEVCVEYAQNLLRVRLPPRHQQIC